jgi:TonB family protein
MTPIKESAEVASAPSASESSQTKGRLKSESSHLRADAVSLEVAVKVHGSLLPSVSPGAGPGGIGQAQPFEEQTSTMIVFPQGSVLKMSTPVSAGQVMVLTNLKSRQDAICRVVKVRAYGAGQSYVEIEFTSPQPRYWGVFFPSDGPEVARMPQEQPAAAPDNSALPSAPAAPQAVAPSLEPIQEPSSAAPAAKLPEPAPISPAVQESPIMPPWQPLASKLPESSFASIGTKEEVLAPADATRERRTTSFAETSTRPSLSADREISAAIDALIAPTTKAVATPRHESREFGGAATMSAKSSEPHSLQTDTRLPMPKQMFGVTLDSATPAIEKSSRQGSGNKLWIGAGIAAVIVVAAGAAYFFRSRPSPNTAVSAPPATSVSAPAAQPSTTQPPVAQTTSQNAGEGQPAVDQSASPSAASPAPDVAPATDALSDAAPQRKSSFDKVDSSPKRRELASNKQEASTKPEPSVAIPSAFGALNTRPVVANHEGAASAGAAPALSPSESPIEPTGSLPGIAPPPPTAPRAPKPVSNAPVRVGGKILPPRLVSSVLPVYPQIARQANVTGTVVIDTTIDKNGSVSKMRVISGPELLRQAALSALRQWKYEPSKLDGQAISVEMIVSIQFH